MTDPLLACHGLTVRFGGVHAVEDLNLRLRRDEFVGLIGPNGAGKTTVFNALSGVCPVAAGRLVFEGRDITGWRPDRITAAGVARTFQNIRLFKDFTALDNVRLACHGLAAYGLGGALFRSAGFRRAEAAIESLSRELLAAAQLVHRAGVRAAALPYGEQRRLEIARALATGPRLLLLDEPAAGLNGAEKAALAVLLRHLARERGLAVLLIDHDMTFLMGLCERVVVLDRGKVIAEGTPREVQGDPNAIRAYLGEAEHA